VQREDREVQREDREVQREDREVQREENKTNKRGYSDVSIDESPNVIWKITRGCVNLWQEVVRSRCNE
jgi:hypothetical protein